ncbi:cytochrome o ubiquinol oxidase subunit 3 [Paraburkholderia bannensis]|uniref:Cytochrome bo(3) ubiquinol oxidase subunit 3 n=1 Tax=Paraburkholderia bannensis TaxID=765414 RepID=A0A7W9WSV4_9BURK|nr:MULTISPECIES: cytochrome o ubiquinol oxidase subunit III [Paraburkholderia]MBB3257704.1 cytochrome o ubiquinol oxidase subunit 3 [Paraburkholderia sp. WP4_3_2]MBB6102717.1 cytochrome o ubiquinol oxidase subunit 3 [Paraburkholderia bannensis]
MANAATTHHGHDHGHSHDDSTKTTLGFWIYLMSDCLIFATLFATFGVLANATAGGPGAKQLFELDYVLGETLLLLASSVTFGLAMLGLHSQRRGQVIFWLVVTFLFGAGFVGMEVNEFAKLVADGAGPHTSAYLSAYFTLVGTHGLHVSAGLLWIAIMMHQTWKFGLTATVRRRLACLSLFWHFLDLVWICVFTFVYLRGML